MVIAVLRYMAFVCLVGAVVSAEAHLINAALTPAPREPFRCFEQWPAGMSKWCQHVRVG